MALTALVAAHAQSAWNRSTRQLTRAGRNLAVAFVVVLWLTFAGAFAIGLAVLGWAAGGQLDGRGLTTAGLVSFGLSWGLGVVFGLTAGGRLLEVGQLKMYPVRPFTLLCAELAARLAEPLTAGAVVALTAFFAGLAVGSPAHAPRLLVLLPLCVWGMLTLQFVLGELVGALARNMRVVIAMLFLLVIGGTPRLVVMLGQASGGHLERAQRLFELARWLPTTRLISAPDEGLPALARVLEGLVGPVLLTLAGIWVMTREQSAHAAVVSEREKGLWTFERPAGGVARLHLSALFRTPVGRYHLVAPLFAMLMIPWLSELAFNVRRASLFVFLYAAFGTVQLHFNVFGFDGAAVSELFRLPITSLDLFRGKHRAVLALALIEGAGLVAFLRLGRSEALDECVAGLCVFLAVNLTMATVGSFVSVIWPRALPRSGMRGSAPPLPVVLVNLFGTLFIVGVMGVSHWAVLRFAPAWLIPWGVAVLSASATVFVLCEGPAARFLDRRREHVLLAMK